MSQNVECLDVSGDGGVSLANFGQFGVHPPVAVSEDVAAVPAAVSAAVSAVAAAADAAADAAAVMK
jgi:hypothetical protein